jgi:hypothetical protein
MQRSYPLRWLALAIGLLGTQCLDSISDDCTKTLTCSDQQPTLQPDCVWRYPDGSVWVGGPRYDEATKSWRWPDGKETDTQDFKCSIGDAGADAGPAGPDCRRPDSPCDLPYVCDLDTGVCVECLEDSECSGAAPVGDAGAANVCDKMRHECVQCLVNDNCLATGDTPICKVDVSDSTRNECVQCQAERDCGGATPACDVNTNECTTRCSTQEECGGDKRFCKVADRICVECLAPGDCAATSTNSQCNVATSECVECVDDSPCAANGEVCDTTRNRCVQCREDVQCAGTPATSHCDTQTNLCVQCLDDLQCSSEASSRCNVAAHVCVGCTADSQCENGLRCNQALGGGTCVQCVDSGDCTTGLQRTCETTSGQCVECLNTSQCLGVETAHCKTEPGGNPMEPLFSCVGCVSETDCGNKPAIPGLCREADGLCVNCETNAECFPDPALSLCGNDGNCGICSIDAHCALFTSPGLGRLACKVGEGCVECVTDDHCEGNTAAPHCKVNDTGASAGDAAVNTCVQCRSNTDCTSPGASVCSNNECVPCADGVDAGCSHIDSNGATAGGILGVCDAGTCVQCAGSKRAACGQFVCNGTTKTCTNDRPARMAGACDSCVSDQECAVNSRCVRQTFGGQELGFSCFPMAAGTPAACAGPRTFLGLVTRATIDGEDATTPSVCQPRQTTCAALAELGAGCDNDAECGEASLADGLCNTDLDQCSVPCAVNNDCALECDLATGSCTLD